MSHICPRCGGPGGVLLLFTVSPCDRCRPVETPPKTDSRWSICRHDRGQFPPNGTVLGMMLWDYPDTRDYVFSVISENGEIQNVTPGAKGYLVASFPTKKSWAFCMKVSEEDQDRFPNAILLVEN